MKQKDETMHIAPGGEASPLSRNGSQQPETPTRRELIEQYGKYAVIAPPLLLFVSKAVGQSADPEIHSVP